jgi:glycosyltransferase involved in cell wall biosynthesis
VARVTLVVNSFDEGSETFLHSLADQLVQLGNEVTVHALLEGRTTMVTGSAFGRGPGVRRSGALPPVRAPRFVPAAGRLVRADRAAAVAALRRAVARFGRNGRAARAAALAGPILATRPDVVHVAFSGIGVALLDSIELLDDTTRLVVSCRGSGELVAPVVDPSLRPRLVRLFGRADAVHAVADVVAAATVDLGADPSTVHVIRPAVEIERFTRDRPRTGPSGPAHVITVARLHWVKGIELQISAAAELRARGHELRWTVVGDGPERTPLELRSEWTGVADVVEFVGAQPPTDVRQLLLEADLFVLSSWSEGTANSVLEAMALEIPVVSTSAGGMGEVLTDGVDAMVVAPGDAGSLADAVERMITQPELAAELAAAGRRTVSGGYTLDRQRRQWGDLYSTLAPGRSVVPDFGT